MKVTGDRIHILNINENMLKSPRKFQYITIFNYGLLYWIFKVALHLSVKNPFDPVYYWEYNEIC